MTETRQLIHEQLEPLEDSACGPAAFGTFIKAARARRRLDPGAAPSQREIGRKVYSWRYFVFYYHPFKFRLKDNWCLPEKACDYLKNWFDGVEYFEGERSTLHNLAKQLNQGRAVAVLIQDQIPDRHHQEGYPDGFDNGHWAIVTQVNFESGWVELADTYRNRPGNWRWFDKKTGVVLTDGNVADRSGYVHGHRTVYRMSLNDFTNWWWDYKFNPAEGKYLRPAVAVDLASLKA